MNRPNPSFAVIIPTYNRAQYIHEAIDSVLVQSPVPDEIIVVDDGSTDNTQEVLAEYGDRIRLIRQENQGVASARNTGIQAAQSDWVTFLDSDDVWCPDRMALLIEDIKRAKHNFIVHVADLSFDTLGDSVKLFPIIKLDVKPGEVTLIEHPLRYFLHGFSFMSAAVRRDALVALGGFDTSYRITEDLNLVHKLCVGNAFFVRGDILARGIRRKGDASALSSMKKRDVLLHTDIYIRLFAEAAAMAKTKQDKDLAKAALSTSMLKRAAILRKQGKPEYIKEFMRSAMAHSNPVKGWGKMVRVFFFGLREPRSPDRSVS